MKVRPEDHHTIFALATASGRAGLAVVRCSGDQSLKIGAKLAKLPRAINSHSVHFVKLRDGNEVIDEACVTYFAQGRSFTGEETLEFSVHGSDLVVRKLFRVLEKNGARLAQRGEFAYRAFLNGKIDLVQAEAILHLIESESAEMTRVSLSQLEGGLSDQLNKLADELLGLRASLEASIDFSSEGLDSLEPERIFAVLQVGLERIDRWLEGFEKRHQWQKGFVVALIGKPNVGKSSLFNAILNCDRSLVSDRPGTTRDYIGETIEREGHLIRFVDTAGLRTVADELEAAGIEQTQRWIASADLVLEICDLSDWGSLPESSHMRVWNKLDLFEHRVPSSDESMVSAKTGQGLDRLLNFILAKIRSRDVDNSRLVLNARQGRLLQTVRDHLVRALELAKSDSGEDLISQELRFGVDALYEILGRVYGDDLLDRVFKDFCIGK